MSITLLFLPYNQGGQQLNPNGNEVAVMQIQNLPLGGRVTIPEATETVRSARVTFENLSVPITRYLGMEDSNNKVIWRSGETTLDQASSFYVLAPERVELSSADVNDMLPSTPITQGDATIEEIDVELKSGKIAVDGAGTFKRKVGSGIFSTTINVNYTFTYSFRLAPYTDYGNVERLVDVVTVDQVDVKGSGFLGFLVSIIANFLEEDLTKDIESTLQQEIDSSVREQVADIIQDNLDSETAAGITATVQKVTINSSGIKVDAVAGIPGSAVECPSSLTARRSSQGKTVGARSATTMKKLRTKRNEILLDSKKGKDYHQLFQNHRKEIFGLLLEHQEIITTSDTAIKNMLTDLYDGDGVISSKTANAIRKLMKDMHPHASKPLQKDIDQILPEIDKFQGQKPKDVLK